MNENQRKWLLDLQSKGVRFENVSVNGKTWYKGTWGFKNDPKDYRIPDQPTHDIPDWREVCMEMYDKGIKFEIFDKWNGIWVNSVGLFDSIIKRYRIPQQPLPEWKEEMTEETKPDPREEIPHRELQIQWHEDKLHSLRTREPMREWEVNYEDEGYWKPLVPSNVSWSDCHKYRRKPRTVTY